MRSVDFRKMKICIVGLGYVGLPLAIVFSKKYRVVGFDINEERIAELNRGIDRTLEVSPQQLREALDADSLDCGLYCTAVQDDIRQCNVFIVAIPTPVDRHNRPDLEPLFEASRMVGKALKAGDIVIYESTVYPGVTEDECVPIIERFSGLNANQDFFTGYSPERTNPGDREYTVSKILKITSGSTPEAARMIDDLYLSVIEAGTYKAPSIKVAEAAKVIENAQRDINIAFVNELAKIFNRMGIDTTEVLAAAGTKWNFLNFRPGLVGGHCVGVDPYYLAQKAQQTGYHPEIILAGRRINDSIGEYVAHEVIKLMIRKNIQINGANILVLGITFKENCVDVRNTKVIDVLNTLKSYGTDVVVFDPWASVEEVAREYQWESVREIEGKNIFDAVILAVAHNEFKHLDINSFCKANRVIYDVKGFLPKESIDGRL
ncbi:MAG TPA: nucleotide sugar dehydrogenase [Mucilaginibacter sp.]|nr:nucleotide sugar dehydrogenase [Mucilaginibacter sp.]